MVSGSRSLKLICPQRRIEAYQGFASAAGFPAAVTITEAAERAMNSRRVMAFEGVLFDLTVRPWKMNLARINHEFPDRGSGEDKRCHQFTIRIGTAGRPACSGYRSCC